MVHSPNSPAVSPADSPDNRVLDSNRLEQALMTGALNWERSQGEWALLCVPSLVPMYGQRIQRLAQALGYPFTAAEVAQLQATLQRKIQAGHDASPYSRLVVRYGTVPPPDRGLMWKFETRVVSPQDQAGQFVAARPPETFEAYPDAMVVATVQILIETLGESLSILDIGGGTGRNGLALADLGHRVTVLDSNGVMLQALEERLAQRSHPRAMTVIEGSVLDERVIFPRDSFDVVILTGVLPYFSSLAELQRVFERVAIALKPGGQVLLDAFVTTDGYEPSPLAQEMGRVSDAMMFPPALLAAAIAGTGLSLVEETDAWAYEMEHLSTEAKQARQWLESWALAKRIFALPEGQRPPVTLKWLRYTKAQTTL